MERRAKIIVTIGPSCQSEAVLCQLIDAGMNVARMNFSHGTHEEHALRISTIRKLALKAKKPISILQDLQGPKLRVGSLPEQGLFLHEGQRVLISSGMGKRKKTNDMIIPLDVPNLERAVKSGNRILLNDGNIELHVLDVEKDLVLTEVKVGGKLTSHKGVNLPGILLETPAFTEKDRRDLRFGLEHDVDVIAVSFVRNFKDIEVVRQAIHELDPEKSNMPIIAKLERPEAIEQLDEIILQSDGVMVARGDLAVETSIASVPIMQKRIIEAANRHSKIVITATQMLESMINNPRPTRAEASDVANAIFDGSDAVMLSAETAIGAYPVQTVRMMDTIIREAEANYGKWGYCEPSEVKTSDSTLSIARAAGTLANDIKVKAIAVFTRSGRTALLISKVRPNVPIYAFTPDLRTYHWLGMLWGVTAFLIPFADTVECMLTYVENELVSNALLQPGQQVVIISGHPVGAFKPANMTLLHTIGQVESSGMPNLYPENDTFIQQQG